MTRWKIPTTEQVATPSAHNAAWAVGAVSTNPIATVSIAALAKWATPLSAPGAVSPFLSEEPVNERTVVKIGNRISNRKHVSRISNTVEDVIIL